MKINKKLRDKLIEQHGNFSQKMYDDICDYIECLEKKYSKDRNTVYSTCAQVFIQYFINSLAQHIISLPMNKKGCLKLFEKAQENLEKEFMERLDKRETSNDTKTTL